MNDDRYMVPALERGLRLLKSFSRERPDIGLADLARELNLPRTTVFRMARTLEAIGFLRRVNNGKTYRLGAAVLGLGFEYLAGMDVTEVAREHLEALSRATGFSTHLGMRDGTDLVYISRYAAVGAVISNIRVGTRLPVHASSMGRILLSDLAPDELDRLFLGRSLQKYTEQTPTSLPVLKAMLARDRQRGYVISRAFYVKGVCGIAAPVRDAAGRVVAAINLIAPDSRIDAGQLEGPLKEAVVDSARIISTWLGYRPRTLGPRIIVA
ncbi:MAG: IclR family transcriptional regulator [Alphaproteobacteria bacterium]|nr:IclR family transcriptional regulator [Alphaproteobacteria bacterium]